MGKQCQHSSLNHVGDEGPSFCRKDSPMPQNDDDGEIRTHQILTVIGKEGKFVVLVPPSALLR